MSSKIPLVFYHSIGQINLDWTKSYLTLDYRLFEDQIRYISRHYKSISLLEYYLIRKGEKRKLEDAIVLTFDDGYLDNWQYAYPILKKYGLKGTIFVSPEFVDLKNGVRPNLEDVWKGRATIADLKKWGFLSWEEMRIMEESGVMDIQSHTMTHTKYPVSDKLTGFHHPGADCLYYTGNLFPENKPYYIEDTEFERLVPFWYPVFEMDSAVIVRKVTINPVFVDYCVETLKDDAYYNHHFEEAFDKVRAKYESMRENESLIISYETVKDYEQRIWYEVSESRRIIENKLNKSVEFLCWPHGDSNDISHKIAIQAGYLATTSGSAQQSADSPDRIPVRIGLFHCRNNRLLTQVKLRYKLGSFLGRFPWKQVKECYEKFQYGKSV